MRRLQLIEAGLRFSNRVFGAKAVKQWNPHIDADVIRACDVAIVATTVSGADICGQFNIGLALGCHSVYARACRSRLRLRSEDIWALQFSLCQIVIDVLLDFF